MKTATVADLRNDFRRVAAWLSQGEEIEIRRRGKPFARLLPLEKRRTAPAKIDFAAQMHAIWGDKVFTADEFKLMRDFEREGEERIIGAAPISSRLNRCRLFIQSK